MTSLIPFDPLYVVLGCMLILGFALGFGVAYLLTDKEMYNYMQDNKELERQLEELEDCTEVVRQSAYDLVPFA